VRALLSHGERPGERTLRRPVLDDVAVKEHLVGDRILLLIDGRHRIAANEAVGNTEIEAEVEEVKDEADLITKAYVANMGGPLPPTQEDTEHTIELLLDRGVAQTQIARYLNLPVSMARKYVTKVKSAMEQKKLRRAADSVTESGMTVMAAAEKHSVDHVKLRAMLRGSRRKQKQGLPEIKRLLSTLFNSHGKKVTNAVKRATDMFEDGDVTARQVQEMIFTNLERLIAQFASAVADKKSRFAAKAADHAAASKKSA